MFAALLSRYGGYLAGILLLALIALALVQHGRHMEQDAQEVRELQSFQHTTEKINEVRPSPSRDAAVDRLRRNGWTR